MQRKKSNFLGMFVAKNEDHNRVKKVNKKETKILLYKVILMFEDGLSELYNFVKDFDDLIEQIKKYGTYEIDNEEVKKAWENKENHMY